MRAFRLGSCASLFGVLLLIVGCAGNYAFVAKGNEQITKEAVIKNCTVAPYTATVFEKDTLTWKVDSTDTNTYTVTFPATKPVPSASFTVTATVPASQAIKRDFGCWFSWEHCYYKYTLTKGNDSCPDPGVHIIPGP